MIHPPAEVDRTIVHAFDPASPVPGGIDSCLRGLCRYIPADVTLAVVGVDSGHGPAERELGRWELHQLGDVPFWFLPVAHLDASNQRRIIPHAIRVWAGVLRFRDRLPRTRLLQVHRMDLAIVLRRRSTPLSYFVHTQENGLVSDHSDSIWRWFGGAHARFERIAARRADSVVVFNPEFAEVVREWNPRTTFMPTWFDPKFFTPDLRTVPGNRVVWVGRLEAPKDPELALTVVHALRALEPDSHWTLHLIGDGTLRGRMEEVLAGWPAELAHSVDVAGRLAPEEVAQQLRDADVFLMTSHPGYEGYPRVLVEALASGTPAVVTEGSDTGGLIDATTGAVCSRDAAEIARAVVAARRLNRERVAARVARLSAPELVREIFAYTVPRSDAPSRSTPGGDA